MCFFVLLAEIVTVTMYRSVNGAVQTAVRGDFGSRADTEEAGKRAVIRVHL